MSNTDSLAQNTTAQLKSDEDIAKQQIARIDFINGVNEAQNNSLSSLGSEDKTDDENTGKINQTVEANKLQISTLDNRTTSLE